MERDVSLRNDAACEIQKTKRIMKNMGENYDFDYNCVPLCYKLTKNRENGNFRQ